MRSVKQLFVLSCCFGFYTGNITFGTFIYCVLCFFHLFWFFCKLPCACLTWKDRIEEIKVKYGPLNPMLPMCLTEHCSQAATAASYRHQRLLSPPR